MDTAVAHRLGTLPRLAVIGAGVAFAWLGLSLTLGLGSADARAADGSDDERSVLGAVTGLVEKTTSTVTTTVKSVTTTVTDVVDEVVEKAPEPVKAPVQKVTEPVKQVVQKATEPVAEVVDKGVVEKVAKPVVAVVETVTKPVAKVVEKVTEPVVETVKEVPIVGDIVTDLGVDKVVSELDDVVAELPGAVTDVTQTVDRTLVDTVGTVETTVDGVLPTGPSVPSTGPDGVLPTLPTLPGLPGTPSLPESPGTAPGDSSSTSAPDSRLTDAELAEAALLARFASATPLSWAADGALAAQFTVAAGQAVASVISLARGALAPADSPSIPGLCLSTASSAGPSGAGPGAWALLALIPFVAHRAWVRRAGPDDEHAPPAPLGSTDVSPD
ncbi:hypothetical protein [Microbacterium sp. C7(2022)]|uniref:hypothetical protein n=1 Tax=Microbacterium sp. C7(2022) TaxID=2992759 RepID=UPI00237BF656|nr:hypothetical protein [Microbacterium sp. C7(2022)]MDE0546333.1 hypothetical protein [Microbacterium sp. C7(2022)]